MAVVLVSLSATLSRTVFVKPPDMQRQYTAIPRAIVNFNILNGVIDAKPLNDTEELIIGMSLDGNFAYRWIDLNFSLIQDVANDWANRAYVEITNGIRNLVAGATQRHVITLDDLTRIPTPVEMLAARAPAGQSVSDLPRYVIQTNPPGSASSPIITFKATNNNVAAGAAGTCNFYSSFFEYDIEQAEAFPLNNPVTVFLR